MAKKDDKEDPTAAYDARLNDVTKTFVILLGVSLFFFFLILIPYFSLRYDSETLLTVDSSLKNTTKIILAVDKILNESKNIQNEQSIMFSENNGTHSGVFEYKKQLEKITFLVNILKISPNSPTIQNVLSDVQIDPICNIYNFSSVEWNNCNYNSKVAEDRKDFLVLTYKDIIPSIRASVISINKTTVDLNNITKSVLNDIMEYKKVLAQKVYLGSPILVEDITPTLHDVNSTMNNYSHNVSHWLQNFCPAGSCRTQLSLTPINTTGLSTLRNDLEDFRSGLIGKEEDVNNKLQKISSMFENFQTPVGTIPIGFQELVALFPFIISILFLFFVYSLSELVQMRSELKKSKKLSSSNESYIVRLLFDPSEKKSKQKLQITLLLIPVLIFASSVVITVLIDFYFDKPTIDSDDPFRAAVGLNKLIYTCISVFAAILMAISLRKLFHTAGNIDLVHPDNSSHGPKKAS